MKKYLLVLFLCSFCYGSSVIITWFENPKKEGVTNYTLYYGTNQGIYSISTNIGNRTNLLISTLKETEPFYYFMLTATSSNGLTSDPSIEVKFTNMLKLTVFWEESTNNKNWITVTQQSTYIKIKNPGRFYRAKVICQ